MLEAPPVFRAWIAGGAAGWGGLHCGLMASTFNRSRAFGFGRRQLHHEAKIFADGRMAQV